MLKHTPDDSPDRHVLEQVITLVRDFLGKVNTESGKTENRFNLVQLNQQLSFKPGEEVVRLVFFFKKKAAFFQIDVIFFC